MFDDKSVLITGGTGSFGNKFAEYILLNHYPRRLIIFSRGELKQHEMRQKFPDTANSPVRYFIGDVRDKERLHRAFNDVDIVIHAAALKQVPTCEYNPFEAIQTNITGAKNVIEAAIEQDVEKVLALSTDKAVNPINLYGATKLCAEKLFVQGNSYSGKEGARFSCVRYGNVVGSRGSVIPVFLEQRKLGKVTITDARMTRFWITLDQGVKFVSKCIGLMTGGEVFVPKIPSMKLMDIVKAIAADCRIETIGIRPGEKLHEVLVSEDEARNAVELDDMYVIKPLYSWWHSDNYANAKKLSDGFRYVSDTNNSWLSIDELRRLVECK